MKYNAILAIIFILCTAAFCDGPPSLSSTPAISYNNITYYDTGFTKNLSLVLNFEDGNGDLGLSPEDIGVPYHPYAFILDNGELIRFGDREGDPDFNCIDYELIVNGTDVDTFLVQRNKYHNNIFIDFFVKRQGVWEEYDLRKIDPFLCADTYDGRFPVLNLEENERAIKGELRYNMYSAAIFSVFRNDTVKLQVQVVDKALNESNIIETPPFTFPQITVTEVPDTDGQ
ncbi:hypothetical protein [Marinigracilibium pacificum]|uniref:Uncharacterized protein n=1 Tax=Marinigracilibium pacificum TaxID=2729599 RepID=A0A848J1S8_9BACT|nr:hypothetical protein [Marinigracilibium pacificum]NMM50527.1 hypothetical protein [Marinigracilibium pacificum]